MAAALRAVQAVTGAPEFAELSADPTQRAATAEDPAGALRTHGVAVPPEIERIEVKRRHTTRVAWARGARGGGVEWRFHVRAGETPFRVIVLCDPWPTDAEGEAAPQDGP